MAISSSQFGDTTPNVDIPLSLSSSTAGSAAGATAWRNRGLAGGRPMAYSKRTAGTTYKFDDDTKTTLPSSDKGMGRNE
jgi:hypothetical protein